MFTDHLEKLELSSDEDERLAAEIDSAIRKSRGYASYWEWASDRKLEELGVGDALVRHLSLSEGLEVRFVRCLEYDPPDIEMITADGRRVGIEVTELVDEKAAQRARFAKRTGEGASSWAHWDTLKLASELAVRIAKKEEKLAHCRGHFDEIILAIPTDEPMITLDMAVTACATARCNTQNIDRTFLLLGYHPNHTSVEYPQGIAVLEIRPI